MSSSPSQSDFSDHIGSENASASASATVDERNIHPVGDDIEAGMGVVAAQDGEVANIHPVGDDIEAGMGMLAAQDGEVANIHPVGDDIEAGMGMVAAQDGEVANIQPVGDDIEAGVGMLAAQDGEVANVHPDNDVGRNDGDVRVAPVVYPDGADGRHGLKALGTLLVGQIFKWAVYPYLKKTSPGPLSLWEGVRLCITIVLLFVSFGIDYLAITGVLDRRAARRLHHRVGRANNLIQPFLIFFSFF